MGVTGLVGGNTRNLICLRFELVFVGAGEEVEVYDFVLCYFDHGGCCFGEISGYFGCLECRMRKEEYRIKERDVETVETCRF